MAISRKYVDLKYHLVLDAGRSTLTVRQDSSNEVGDPDDCHVAYNANSVEDALAQLQRKRLAVDELKALGEVLGDWLIPVGSIRDAYGRARVLAAAGSVQGGVRIRVITRDAELARIPWEYAFLPSLSSAPAGHLGLDPLVSIVRHPPADSAVPQSLGAVPPVLRMVASVTNAPQHDKLNLVAERRVLRDLQRSFGATHDGFTLDLLQGRVTAPQIVEALQSDATFFHFAGHGGVTDPAQADAPTDGYLAMVDATNATRAYQLAGQQLAPLLQNANVRVAVLGACETGFAGRRDIWDGMAAALVQRQIFAVVGMQYEINNDSASQFAKAFYKSIAAADTLDVAVTNGRQAIRNGGGPNAETEWGIPVLYMRAATGSLFLFPRATLPSNQDLALPALPELPAGHLGRLVEREQVMTALRKAGSSPILITGPTGSGKSTLALDVAHRVQDEFEDGALYVDLEHADPGRDSMTRLMRQILAGLNVPRSEIPRDADGIRGKYRSARSQKSFLLLLDNAHNSADVRDLLPESEFTHGRMRPSATIVTGRARINTLTPRVVRLGRRGGGRSEAGIVIQGDYGVASAVKVGGRKAPATGWPQLGKSMVGRTLASQASQQFDSITKRRHAHSTARTDPGTTEVRTAVVLAYDRLRSTSPRAARLFLSLGALRAGTFLRSFAEALEQPPKRGGSPLAKLVAAGLADDLANGWVRLHAAVATVAADMAVDRLSEEDRESVLLRAGGFFWSVADRIDKQPSEPIGDPSWAVVSDPRSVQIANLIESQGRVLTTVVQDLSKAKLFEQAYALAERTRPLLTSAGAWALSRELAAAAIEASRTSKVPSVELRLIVWKAEADARLGSLREARTGLADALARADAIKEDSERAFVLDRAPIVFLALGEPGSALEVAKRLVALRDTLDDKHAAARARIVLAACLAEVGSQKEGLTVLRPARKSLRDAEDDASRWLEAQMLAETGWIEGGAGGQGGSVDFETGHLAVRLADPHVAAAIAEAREAVEGALSQATRVTALDMLTTLGD